MQPVMVINVVGLTLEMIGPETPHLRSLMEDGFGCPMTTVLPAVTCSAQATLLTGTLPREHGIVGNGWYARDLAEVMFWKQSNHLIQAEPVFRTAKRRDQSHRTAKMFWWYNMYSGADFSMTPRPSYPADGRKIFDSYSHPPELRDRLQDEFGVFPLPAFWGPTAGIESSEWIANASIRVLETERPELTLVYLPHLDYDLQRFGPDSEQATEAVREIDRVVGTLLTSARGAGAEVVVVSEYALTSVSQPVHINRFLREQGDLVVRREPLGWETLDAGASKAFAVADHQVAHIYVNDAADLSRIQANLAKLDGVESVLDRQAQAEFGIDHERSGDLIAIAAPDAWFTYYFWLDDAVAPDYARCIDIHRKPGYDPCELFVDPKLRYPMARVARRLAQKKLGFRYYMDVIPLDASLVKGSHGRLPTPGRETSEAPVFLTTAKQFARDSMAMTDVKQLLLDLQFST